MLRSLVGSEMCIRDSSCMSCVCARSKPHSPSLELHSEMNIIVMKGRKAGESALSSPSSWKRLLNIINPATRGITVSYTHLTLPTKRMVRK
eukprot:TRINITY_DN52520_c0_g1_i1.p1 TRINITY_DN52520_c0_g1~~TRINITY_DN52520_c0_g1_i1.p1  ORF type:complete len:101 (-),score=25.98 TRINITY_DN52520_c0_g1_i1:23-295(-)